MKKQLILIIFLLICRIIVGQNHWIPDISKYPGNMSIIAVVEFDDVEQKSPDLELAVFCGDELRGSNKAKYISKYDRYFVFLTAYGEDNDVLNFKLFDHALNAEMNYDTETEVIFKTDNTIGNMDEPIQVNFYPITISGNHWNPDSGIYPSNMSVIAVIKLDGIEIDTNTLELGVFCGKELRGARKLEYILDFDRYFTFITVYGNDNDSLTFKIFNHETLSELNGYNCENILIFQSDNTVGNVVAPYEINFFSESFIFIGNGSWNDSTNWNKSQVPSSGDMVVIDGSAIIPEGVKITINDIVINNNGLLTIENGASLSVTSTFINENVESLVLKEGGQIFQNCDNVAATFIKNIINPVETWGEKDQTGWHFISSPIIDNEINDFIPLNGNYDLYKYDGSIDSQWVNYKKHHQDDFEMGFVGGTGYLAAYETEKTMVFSGELYSEKTFLFPVAFCENNIWANFYLLGNPFSFNIDWSCANIMGIENAFATINPQTGAYVYNKEGEIKVGEGFMVYSKNADAYLKYEHKSKSRENRLNYVNITASGNNGSDNVILSFDEYDGDGFPKLKNFNEKISNIYVKDANQQCAIGNYTYNTKEIPLYFDTKVFGYYTLYFDFNGDFDYAHLLDLDTGEDIDILVENKYKFISSVNDPHNRFVIKLCNGENENSKDDKFAYINNSNLIVYDINGHATISIYDINGHSCNTSDCAENVCLIPVSSLASGVYLIRKIDENGIKTQKVVVQ